MRIARRISAIVMAVFAAFIVLGLAVATPAPAPAIILVAVALLLGVGAFFTWPRPQRSWLIEAMRHGSLR